MRWREAVTPITMQRVALLAPTVLVRDVLVQVAEAGVVQLDEPRDHEKVPPRLVGVEPRISASQLDLAWCAAHGRDDLLAGESALEARIETGVRHGSVTGFVGWVPENRVAAVADAVAPAGGAVLALARPAHIQPPTLLADADPGRPFAPLVETYTTVPYRDVDPAIVAGIAYVVMFGMMFADAGQGALLLTLALVVRFGHWPRLQPLRRVWLFLAGGGFASMVFGLLYGEFFGPTGVIPVVWTDPIKHPLPLLAAAVGIGAFFLAGSYVLGAINRVREGGWRLALYAPTGIGGAALFAGLAVTAAGLYADALWLIVVGAVLAAAAVAVVFTGRFAASGGGGTGGAEAGIEVFDLVVRLGSNLVSFVRLAAFGVTHAALGAVVWDASSALWRRGGLGFVLAVVVFIVGNALAFALEALVAAVQALRLEYYELFSRVFVGEGEPFRPWKLPIDRDVPSVHEEASCRAG